MRVVRTIVPAVHEVPSSGDDINGQICVVMEQFPDLSAYGFHFRGLDDWDDTAKYRRDRAHMVTADFANQVTTCIEAFTAPRSRRYTWRLDRHSSYSMKHLVEQWAWESKRDELARYVSNGAFIVAAAIDGWIPVRLERSPNCGFRREAAR